jgi:hypothetical protein
MQDEYDALVANNTWHLLPPSSNKNVIDCKNGFIASRKMLMALWTGTKHILLQKDSNNDMV